MWQHTHNSNTASLPLAESSIMRHWVSHNPEKIKIFHRCVKSQLYRKKLLWFRWNNSSLAHAMAAHTKMLLAVIFPSREQDLAPSLSGHPTLRLQLHHSLEGWKAILCPFLTNAQMQKERILLFKKSNSCLLSISVAVKELFKQTWLRTYTLERLTTYKQPKNPPTTRARFESMVTWTWRQVLKTNKPNIFILNLQIFFLKGFLFSSVGIQKGLVSVHLL